jgi:predicted HTH domain antitoxin
MRHHEPSPFSANSSMLVPYGPPPPPTPLLPVQLNLLTSILQQLEQGPVAGGRRGREEEGGQPSTTLAAIMEQQAKEQLQQVIPDFMKVQDWFIIYGDDPVRVTKGSLWVKPTTNVVEISSIELRELRRNRDGRYLFDKVLKASPENLFKDPDYYVLRYRLPEAPFDIDISLCNNVRGPHSPIGWIVGVSVPSPLQGQSCMCAGAHRACFQGVLHLHHEEAREEHPAPPSSRARRPTVQPAPDQAICGASSPFSSLSRICLFLLLKSRSGPQALGCDTGQALSVSLGGGVGCIVDQIALQHTAQMGWLLSLVQDLSFRNRANLARIINDQYLEGKIQLGEASKLLSLEMKALQREVYLMLPVQDKEDHEYLIYEKPKEPPQPAALYLKSEISLQEYEDLMFPGEETRKRRAGLVT